MASTPRRQRRDGARRSAGLRVIGGVWRGRVLPVADQPGLRPTPNRVRETLFNWLAPRIDGACCIDLFAGTGALGIEALSRGAAQAVFVERDARPAHAIEAALDTLGAGERARVLRADAMAALRGGGLPEADIVFIDPPFADALHEPALAGVRGLLSARSRVYLEYPAETETAVHARLSAQAYEILRAGRAAGVGYCLAQIVGAGEHDRP